MPKLNPSTISIRPLQEGEPVPYQLLFMADPSKELVDEYVKQGEVVLAVIENEVMGVYVLLPIDAQQAEIKNIAVSENHQQKGVGTLLLTDATERAKRNGYTELIIGTANSSIHQLNMYQKAGFALKEIKKNFFFGSLRNAYFRKWSTSHRFNCFVEIPALIKFL